MEKTKHCNKCNTTKTIDHFAIKTKDRLQSVCKECQRTISKLWYENNKQRQLKNTARNNHKQRQRFQKWKNTLSCILCDEQYSGCLDFHHLDPSKKDFSVSRFTNVSFEKLSKELEKCVVLCRNCHSKVHGNRISLLNNISTCKIIMPL